ncbi:glycosyltransferase [Clostridium algoriphilum]|uniref:glycosyltransferase n=1 Tax=Clostridium algoriphilum TaxID=198347 RepID=UPI001CF1475A|nr:glycosyltransferase [Clostridium algoriphilum]MCB2295319.1 glycosyltransferase [Clostridium algoriphilum]
MKNSVCCVIVTYNIGIKFYECFNAIINQVEKVVIVDNGSDNETLNVLDDIKLKYDVIVIYNKNNMGIANALNLGVKYALDNKYEWILTMDNDSQATENMVKVMLSCYETCFKSNDNIVGLFPEYIDKSSIKDKEIYKSTLGNYSYNEIGFDNTSGNLVKSDVFINVGSFKEKLFIDSVDHDFCLRVKQSGERMVKVRNAKLLHSLGNTKVYNFFGVKINCSNHSALRRYYVTRNRCYMRAEYKNDKEYMKYDRKTFINENLKIIIFEKDKINKMRMSIKGYQDFKNNKFGEFN